MQRLRSIFFMMLILASGMHIFISTHYCGGKVAAVKISLSGAHASCGMENTETGCPGERQFASNCCRDELAVYSVDQNYFSSSLQIQKSSVHLAQEFFIPVNFILNSLHGEADSFTSLGPPDDLPASAVDLAGICLFRI